MSRKTKKAVKNYFDKMGREYIESEDYILDSLPKCHHCDGSGYEYEYNFGEFVWRYPIYKCPDCEGTGRADWRYDSGGKITPINPKLSNNTLRLKQKGVLKHKRVKRCCVCQKNNVYGYKPDFCCSGYMCGCMGLPIEPPLCSKRCTEKVFGKRSRRKSR